jgi:hypothetical protein
MSKMIKAALWAGFCCAPAAWAAPSSCDVATLAVESTDVLGMDVVAGRPHAFEVAVYLKNPGTGVCEPDSSYAGAKALDAWFAANGAHPSGAAAPAISANANCSGSVALPSSAPGSNASSNTLTLNFSSGRGAFYLCSSDVGRYALGVADDATTPGQRVSGMTGDMAARPFALWLDQMTDIGPPNRTFKPNPKTTATAGDEFFVRAGANFLAKATAKAWMPGQDSEVAGRPNAAANLSSNPTLARFSNAATVSTVAGSHTPTGGVMGALSGTTSLAASAFAGGVASLTLAYSEAGSVKLAVSASNYLGMSNVPAAPSETVGRFYPAYIQTSNLSLKLGCGASTHYMGQPMVVGATLTALSIQSTVTRNYDSALNFYNLHIPKFAANNTAAGTLMASRLSSSGTQPTWGQGVMVYENYPVTFAKLASNVADGPFDQFQFVFEAIQVTPDELPIFKGQEVDVNGGPCGNRGTCTGKLLGPSFRMRNGRLKIANAYGAVLPSLRTQVTAEYWNATGWTTNTLDSCTEVPLSAVAVGGFTGTVASASASASAPGPLKLTSGKATLVVTRGGGSAGSAVVGINLSNLAASPGSCDLSLPSTPPASLPWLRSAQCGLAVADPNAKIIWGVPNGRGGSVVFSRESY